METSHVLFCHYICVSTPRLPQLSTNLKLDQ